MRNPNPNNFLPKKKKQQSKQTIYVIESKTIYINTITKQKYKKRSNNLKLRLLSLGFDFDESRDPKGVRESGD